MKIAYITILYNKKYDMVSYDMNNLFFFDNSVDKSIICYNKKNPNVYSMDGNLGLSKVYNVAIEKLKPLYDYLVILDDDSILEKDFEEKLKREILTDVTNGKEYRYYLPKIISLKTKEEIYPNYSYDNIIKDIIMYKKSSVSSHKKKITTINSGLVIKLDSKTIKYNEKFFLYYVDTYYSRHIINETSYKKMDLKVFQNFSRESTTLKEKLLYIRKEKKDGKLYFKKIDFLVLYSVEYIWAIYTSIFKNNKEKYDESGN